MSDNLHEAKFDEAQPNTNSLMNSNPVRENFQSLQLANHLRVRQLDPPELKVYVEPGILTINKKELRTWMGGTFPGAGDYPIPTTSSVSRIDLLGFHIDNGSLQLDILQGTESDTPTAPDIPAAWAPLSYIRTTAGIQAITGDMISEARFIVSSQLVPEDSVNTLQIAPNSVGEEELDSDNIPFLRNDGTIDSSFVT